MLVKRLGLMSERCVSSRTASMGECESRGGGGGIRVAAVGMLAVVLIVVVGLGEVVSRGRGVAAG